MQVEDLEGTRRCVSMNLGAKCIGKAMSKSCRALSGLAKGVLKFNAWQHSFSIV